MSDEGNTCPGCEGGGLVYEEILSWGYWEPPEYMELVCPVCGGTGIITEPVTEEDIA